jgi:hypothetical protein
MNFHKLRRLKKVLFAWRGFNLDRFGITYVISTKTACISSHGLVTNVASVVLVNNFHSTIPIEVSARLTFAHRRG